MMASWLLRRGLLPDAVVRWGIRRLLRRRLGLERARAPDPEAALAMWADELRRSPIAVHTEAANDQHYEVPAAFYEQVLGRHLKYSCGWWGDGVRSLDDAEAAMLRLTAERAGIAGGMDVLDLGCGWGSFSLWIAARHPACRVVAVSNSHGQRAFIETACRQRGLRNVEVVTADVNELELDRGFDRVVSVEMFEHVRNYQALLAKIDRWLRDDGALFTHMFVHRCWSYPFETTGSDDWMGRHFFTGGQMPAEHLLDQFDDHLGVVQRWRVDGRHYARTAEQWLANFDARRERIAPVLQATYGAHWRTMANYWRAFFMACAELWGYDGGSEWFVAHCLLRKVGVLDQSRPNSIPVASA